MPIITIVIQYSEGEGNAPSAQPNIFPIIREEIDYRVMNACDILNFENVEITTTIV